MAQTNQDLISVIIPVYHSENTVLRCIKSVCDQTYKNLEIIIVYKKSDDKSLDIIKSVPDPRIKIIEQVADSGPGGARNIGIENANGEWLGFVEADDFIANDFYENLHNAAIQNNCDIAQGNIIFKERHPETNIGIYTTYYDKLSTIHSGASFDKLFKKDLILANNVRFAEKIRWEDNIFVIKALFYSQKLAVTDAEYFLIPHELSPEYMEKLRAHIVPACQEIADFIQSERMSAAEKRLTKQKIVIFVANPFICDNYIYYKLMNMFGSPLFLWVRHHRRNLKQKIKKGLKKWLKKH